MTIVGCCTVTATLPFFLIQSSCVELQPQVKFLIRVARRFDYFVLTTCPKAYQYIAAIANVYICGRSADRGERSPEGGWLSSGFVRRAVWLKFAGNIRQYLPDCTAQQQPRRQPVP
jgi:hypothetical protein